MRRAATAYSRSFSRVASVRSARALDPAALRNARIRAGLTQSQLARRIDVAGGERVSQWELGEVAPRPEVLGRVADALGVSVPSLLTTPTSQPDLRTLRLEAALSAAQVAARAHLTTPTYLRWETGRFKRMPSPQDIHCIAEVLGVTAQEVETALQRTQSTGT
jgi:transcriptional regulator with XRE-family HTH domain